MHREEAVDAITEALDFSLTDANVRENCCKALLILRRYFSFSGKSLSRSWILKPADFSGSCEVNSLDSEDGSLAHGASPSVHTFDPHILCPENFISIFIFSMHILFSSFLK